MQGIVNNNTLLDESRRFAETAAEAYRYNYLTVSASEAIDAVFKCTSMH
jgi:hypothetical protein